MRRASVVLLSLAVVALITGLSILKPSSRTTANQPGSDAVVQAPASENPSEPANLNSQKAMHQEPVPALSPLSPTEKANSAADFNKLPLAQQQEIKALSGRESDAGKSYQTIEVAPGVVAVMANNGPKVVPVAVINEDGTVSIHEY